jgi:hypothetical protein
MGKKYTKDDPKIAAGASAAYENMNKTLASALGVQPERRGRPTEKVALHLKRVEYKTKLLKIRNEEAKKAGKPIRHPRLDKARNRPLPQ